VLLRRVRPLLRPTEFPGHIRAVPNPSDRMAHTYLLSITRTAPHRGPPLAIGI
jgi:hypothetical protein